MPADPPEPELGSWLTAQLDDPGPFELRPISGGNSNETALITARSGRRWILRRPPATTISATANNLGREYRILRALADQPVPAPGAVAFAEAGTVGPRSCLVLEFADGSPLTDRWPHDWPTASTIGDAGHAAVAALAALHDVDHRAAGLSDFGRPENYLQRQVARWRGQFEQYQVRDLPMFGELADWLSANLPDASATSIVHGDFHLDNCLISAGPPTRVNAIIDWELATLGDPLVDLGLLLAFWGPDRVRPFAMPRVQALTRESGAPDRRELADHYTELTGRSSDALAFYLVLAFFKLAAIVEGAYARVVHGDDDSPWARSLGQDVPRLLADAASFRP